MTMISPTFEEKKECVILCGLPASGKSFRRDQLIREAKERNGDSFYFFVYSTDDVLEDFALLTDSSYDEVFANTIGKATKVMDLTLKMAIQNDVRLIIWDQTNLSLKKRNRIRSLLSPHGYSFTVDCILPPSKPDHIAIWENRLKERKDHKNLSDEILDQMRDSYEIPTAETDGPNIVWRNLVSSV